MDRLLNSHMRIQKVMARMRSNAECVSCFEETIDIGERVQCWVSWRLTKLETHFPNTPQTTSIVLVFHARLQHFSKTLAPQSFSCTGHKHDALYKNLQHAQSIDP